MTIDDRFHIGSDTKAMTALLAGSLVGSGKLKWETTVAEIFPELKEKMDHALKQVTIWQLLSHSAGMPSDEKAGEMLVKAIVQPGNLDEVRYWFVRQGITESLGPPPSAEYAYSKIGYVVAGAMIERVAGKPWEELMTDWIFDPLGLKTAGLGPQASLGRTDGPLGHAWIDGKIKVFTPGPGMDNPPVAGPAGTAHMSVLDFARWAGWNAGEGKRGPHVVSPGTLKKLHTPVISIPSEDGGSSKASYCLGWEKTKPEWATEELLTHSGSNNQNYATIYVEPKSDFAMVLMTNIAGDKAQQAFKILAPDLYKSFAAPKP